MKKTIAALFVLGLSISLVACGNKSDQDPTATVTPTVTETPTEEPTDIPTENPTENPEEDTADSDVEKTLASIHQAVKDVFLDDYIPSQTYDAALLEEKFGLKAELYDGVIAEGPMISTHVDELIIVHATEGNLELVQQALTTYQEKLKKDQMQYPMNVAKIQGSVVETIDDYVIFSMLGFVEDEALEEAALVEAYTELNQKTIDAAKEVLGK